MILTISALALYFATAYWTIIVRLHLLEVSVTCLRCCDRLCHSSCVVKLLYFIRYTSSSHKSVFFVVFQRLLYTLHSLLVNHLVIIITFSDLIATNETIVKYILLPLPAVYSRNTSLGIFSHLCSDCLS